MNGLSLLGCLCTDVSFPFRHKVPKIESLGKVWPLRQNLLQEMTCLLIESGEDDCNLQADQAVLTNTEEHTAFTREEANEEAKLKAIRVLGGWLPCLEQWPPVVLERLAAGLKEKDTLKRAFIRALNQVSCRPKNSLTNEVLREGGQGCE